MRNPFLRAPGFSILETMIAMVVLSIGLIGALAALQRGATESRLGQTRQVKLMLAEAALQRVKLQNKSAFFTGLPAQPTVDIKTLAVGTAPWVSDPTSSADPNDFSQGAFFNILPDGTITRAAVVGPCTAATVPVGTICREVFTHTGGPYHATNVAVPTVSFPAGAQLATVWVRVSRKTSATDPLAAEIDVILNQVVAQ